MEINFNLEKFRNAMSEEQPEYLKLLTPGVFKAIEAGYVHGSSEQVNWDSFTLNEAQIALSHAMGYESQESCDNENESFNQGNAVHEYFHSLQCISDLRRATPEKIMNDCSFF